MVTAMIRSLQLLAVCIGTVGLLMIFVLCCYLMLCVWNSVRTNWTQLFGASPENQSKSDQPEEGYTYTTILQRIDPSWSSGPLPTTGANTNYEKVPIESASIGLGINGMTLSPVDPVGANSLLSALEPKLAKLIGCLAVLTDSVKQANERCYSLQKWHFIASGIDTLSLENERRDIILSFVTTLHRISDALEKQL